MKNCFLKITVKRDQLKKGKLTKVEYGAADCCLLFSRLVVVGLGGLGFGADDDDGKGNSTCGLPRNLVVVAMERKVGLLLLSLHSLQLKRHRRLCG